MRARIARLDGYHDCRPDALITENHENLFGAAKRNRPSAARRSHVARERHSALRVLKWAPVEMEEIFRANDGTRTHDLPITKR